MEASSARWRNKIGRRCRNAAIVALACVCAANPPMSQAAPLMSGGPYAIVSDVALAGSAPMAAGSYRIVATVGEAATTGPGAAGGYRVFAGFWQGERFIPQCMLDIDGNGVVEPAFDGLLITRALNGLRGQPLVDGALGTGAQYTDPAQILARINLDALDVDGDQKSLSSTDGLIIVRVMSGIRSDNLVAGATGPGATRMSWAQIRNHLNNICSAGLAP